MKGGVGLVRCLKAEGINWVATFPASTVNEVLAEEGVRHILAREERTAVAIADSYSRVSDGKRFGVATCMGGINAAGIQYAYGRARFKAGIRIPIRTAITAITTNNSINVKALW